MRLYDNLVQKYFIVDIFSNDIVSAHPEPLKRRIQLIQKTLLDNATAFIRAKQTTFKK